MKTLLVILLMALPCLATAQTISIGSAPYPCLGAPHKIQTVVTGTFAADNKFTIQVRAANTSTILSEVPATYKSPTFEAVYTDSSLSLVPQLEFRIVASNPQVESAWKKFIIISKGTVSLAPSLSDTINAGDDLPIVFKIFSKRPVTILLSNGQRYTVPEYKLGYYDSFWKAVVPDEKAFKIVKAENSCGLMQTSGLIKPVFNPVSVRAHLIAPHVACEETDLRVAISTAGGTFDAATNYSVRFREITREGTVSRSVTVPAVLRDSLVVVKVPKLNPGIRVRYQIQVITANPATVSAPALDTLTIYPKPSVSFATEGATLVTGQSAEIQVKFSGIPPFWARLSNGTELSAEDNAANPRTTVTPFRTTSYAVDSFRTGCESAARPASNTVTFTVKPGLSVTGSARVCAGSWGKLPFIVNIPEESAKSFKMYGYISGGKPVYTFEARRVGDAIEFFVPELPSSTPHNLSYDQINGYNIVSGDSLYSTGGFSDITILSKPNYSVRSTSVLEYNKPELINLTYELTGNGPYTIEYGQSKKAVSLYQRWGHPSFYVTKDTSLIIRSVSNSCFKTERETVSPISFKPGPATILLTPLEMGVCVGDSIEFTFQSFGDFLPGNEFLVQGLISCCNWETWATVTEPGTHKIKFPATRDKYHYIYLRISGTNPTIFSQTLRITQRSPIRASGGFHPLGTEKSPFTMVGVDSIEAYIKGSSGGTIQSWIYSDGMTEMTANVDRPTFLRVAPGEVKTFTIKAVANECGPLPVNISTTLANVPYRVTIPDYSRSMDFFCLGKPVSIPYEVYQGKVNVRSKFRLELSKPDETTYRTIVDGETSGSFKFYFPDDLVPGSYAIRVTSSDGAMSGWKPITVAAPPTAIISSDLPQPIKLNYGEKLTMNLAFRGSSPYSAVFEDNAAGVYNSPTVTREIMPYESGDYSIKSVSNVCGFGSVNGQIAVDVRPYPVRLISFDAILRERSTDLIWRTSDERNSDRFLIERSVNGRVWHPIGEMAAQGESTDLRSYSMIDPAPEKGQNLYRLKMIDLDGSFSYSSVAVVFLEHVTELGFYPNPASDELRLSSANDLKNVKSVRISDVNGVEVYASDNIRSSKIDIKNLPNGTYILKIELADGYTRTHRFVKIR